MFEKFSVIDLIKTRSASVCTFAGNVVKFNVQTAQELRFPEYRALLQAGGRAESADQNQQRHGCGYGQKVDGLECRG